MSKAQHWFELAVETRKRLRKAKDCRQRFRNLRALASQLQTARVHAVNEGDRKVGQKIVRAQRSLQSVWSAFEDRCVR